MITYSKLLVATVIVLLLQNGLAHSQTGNSKKTTNTTLLPLDPAVRKGTLTNGFTYYIRRNTEPKNRVVFYLANKVGSILENDDQRGLAHFMEHMSFNGTKHYPKNELVNYLQKSGVRFGADLNAYTSFDETVYQLPLPSDNPELLKNGIQILRDWAQDALLEQKEIDQERGIVLEEKRLSKGAGERMQQLSLPVLYNQSRYANRSPIGTEEVLKTFDQETLKQFYKDWYRPNLQALIVVGDVDVNEIEKTIKGKFSDLKNPKIEKIRPDYKVSLNGKNQYIAITDPEMTGTVAQVMIKRKSITVQSVSDYRQSMVQDLFNAMLAERYEELVKDAEPPFIQGSAGVRGIINGVDAFNASVVAKPGELESGFKAVWREVERLKLYGFTKTELERAKINFKSKTDIAYRQRNQTRSDRYVQDYLDNFLNGTASPGVAKEYQLVNSVLPAITLKDVNSLAGNFTKDVNRDIIIKAPEKDKNQLPGEAIFLTWMEAVRQEQLKPYVDDALSQPLLVHIPVAGKIVKQSPLSSLGATELRLSNGVRVILKPTTFKENDIRFTAYAPGGTSLYSDADFESADNASSVVSAGGIGQFNMNQLQKVLAGKQVNVAPFIGELSQGIYGSTTTQDLETEMKLIYLYFTQPRKDEKVFQSEIARAKAGLAYQGNDPNSIFSDTVSAVIGNYNIRKTGPSIEKLDAVDLEKCLRIYKERFGDAGNFTFTFVGSLDIEKIKPLLETYLGSLPSTNIHEEARNLNILPPSGKIYKTVYRGKEEKASVTLLLTGPYEFEEKNNKVVQALAEVLEIRLLERLRETEGGVYAPSCNASYVKYPTGRCGLEISFGCSPENTEKLIASALDELNKLREQGPDEVNILKFKAENKRAMEPLLRSNGFWLNYISGQLQNKMDLNEINRYDETLDAVTRQSIQLAARKYFSGDNLLQFVLMPEKN